jgi:hypothetical protein
METLLARLDRIAGGRHAGYRVPDEGRDHPRTRRAFTVIAWLLTAELVIGLAAVVVAVVLAADGVAVAFPVWMRSVIAHARATTGRTRGCGCSRRSSPSSPS